MSKVWIAEKPSAAADLAAGICLAFGLTSQRDRDGLIHISNGDTILPLAGHLLETVKPGHYLSQAHGEIERTRNFPKYADFLPVLPKVLIKQPRTDGDAKSSKPFRPYLLAAKILPKAKEIVNAGDTDREGQLIVDELLEHLDIDPYGQRPMVWRFGVPSNLAEDIAKALKQPMQKNSDDVWRLRGAAAQTRQYLDFVWGMNFSMVGQVQNNNPRISAGRVQTPVLAMVQARDAAIDKFVPVTYFVPVIHLKDGTKMRWTRREGSEGLKGFDAQGRIIDEAIARKIVASIAQGMPGEISIVKATEHKEKPPLPFSMGTLLSKASKELGITLDEVKEIAGSLNKKHKAISYVGTDCKFLPTTMHSEAPVILRTLAKYFPKVAVGANPALVSPAFNDSKLDEHYAIIPTKEAPTNASADELAVYRIVAKRYMAQFYPDNIFRREKLEAKFGEGDCFESNLKRDLQLGWKEVESTDDVESEQVGDVDAQRDKDQPEQEVVEVSR